LLCILPFSFCCCCWLCACRVDLTLLTNCMCAKCVCVTMVFVKIEALLSWLFSLFIWNALSVFRKCLFLITSLFSAIRSLWNCHVAK
jgi:hypothetical protein